MLTLPAAAGAAAGAYGLTRLLGGGMTGSLVLFVVGLIALLLIFGRRLLRPQPVPVTQS